MSGRAERLQRLRHDPQHREKAAEDLGRYLDVPMSLVSVLLVLVAIINLSGRLSGHYHGQLLAAQWGLWALFAVEYIVRLMLAPRRLRFLKRHWAGALVVVFPFLGFIRILTGILPLVRLGLYGGPVLRPYMGIIRKRHLGRLALISIIAIFIAASLEYILEQGAKGGTIGSFADAVWYAAATATTIGSQLYPVTPGGEIVAFLLMLFAIGVFSYVTSSIASALIGGDAAQSAASNGSSPSTDADPSSSLDVNVGTTAGAQEVVTRTVLSDPRDGLTLTPEEVAILRSILARWEQSQTASGARSTGERVS